MNALTPDLLDALAADPITTGLARLDQLGLTDLVSARALADAALAHAEDRPQAARRWLDLAAALNSNADPDLSGRAAYAQARLALVAGDLTAAETNLRQAQAHWLASGDRAGLVRSYLGLTQILTVTGRYAQAEQTVRLLLREVNGGNPQSDPQGELRIFGQINLGNLLRYQDRHADALAAYDHALTLLAQLALSPDTAADQAHIQVNRATCLMFTDRPLDAENALTAALALLGPGDDGLNRGRANTNLGSLHLRTGQYAAALADFDRAAADLLTEDPEADPRQADILLLDRANAYLALNLLPEALADLDRCVSLFSFEKNNGDLGQPYERGQTFYLRGLALLRQGSPDQARADLIRAADLFRNLGNDYWILRSELALAGLEAGLGQTAPAAARLDTLSAPDAPAWDLVARTETRLLRARLLLDAGDWQSAQAQVNAAQSDVDAFAPPPSFLFPHLRMKLAHTQGRLAQAQGDWSAARTHFRSAVALLEDQRISLPLEEVRTTFLDDKSIFYRDLVLNLLDAPNPTPDQLAAVFAVIEQARSRALLERLLAAVNAGESAADQTAIQRREAVRQELTWIYNQLLGEGGSRKLTATLTQQMKSLEDALRQVEWQLSPLLAQTQPVDLAALQSVLAPDQQAIVYFVAESGQTMARSDGEIMAFVVGANRVELVRRLCTLAQLHAAQADLRFQLGRAELGADYLARHADRLQTALHRSLYQLYHLLVAPLDALLTTPRLLVIPHGPLHVLPFHALWDGADYLLSRFEIAYAPSASVAVRCALAPASPFLRAHTSLAALAITDPSIPQARREAETVAARFALSQLFLGEAAGRAGLTQAAAQADVLHIATHGLFRPDNPFFSALKLADGWLDVREIYRLPLRARLVVLSACESGVGQVRGVDEVIGLVRGFLGAGAVSLVVSLWNVHDAGAVGLMDDFYRHLTDGAGQRPAAALAAAQRHAAQSGQHLYFWAPFVAIG